NHSVTLRVSDGRGGTATQAFVINVTQEPGNHPPVIVSTPVTTALQGQPYTYQVKAIDPDKDPLTYSLTSAPAGMVIDSITGLISWSAPSLTDGLVSWWPAEGNAADAWDGNNGILTNGATFTTGKV